MPRGLHRTTTDAVHAAIEAGWSHTAIMAKLHISRVTLDRVITGQKGERGRCPGCGGIVTLPCRLCQVRECLHGGRLPAEPEACDGPEDGQPSPAEIAAQCQAIRAKAGRRVMRRISAEDRLKMVAMRALGYSYHQIAEEMGIPDGSAWSAIHCTAH